MNNVAMSRGSVYDCRNILYLRYRIQPAFHNDSGRVGGEDKLYIGVQVAYHTDEFLLPFDMQRGFRLVHKEHAVAAVAHEDGKQDNQHLLLAGG